MSSLNKRPPVLINSTASIRGALSSTFLASLAGLADPTGMDRDRWFKLCWTEASRLVVDPYLVPTNLFSREYWISFLVCNEVTVATMAGAEARYGLVSTIMQDLLRRQWSRVYLTDARSR